MASSGAIMSHLFTGLERLVFGRRNPGESRLAPLAYSSRDLTCIHAMENARCECQKRGATAPPDKA
jgi:hypothetical protein